MDFNSIVGSNFILVPHIFALLQQVNNMVPVIQRSNSLDFLKEFF